MDAGSWMEAFERASERLVEDWQVKLVTAGLLAEGVFPVELISLFALAVFIDLVTKWMALAHNIWRRRGKRIVIWYRVFWRFPRRIGPE